MPSEGSTQPRQAFLTRPLVVLLLLALLAIAIYSNTFSAPFYFDDIHNIGENPRIKHLSNFTDLSGTRSVGFLSFALNYHFGSLNVFGYHLINLLIHIANGFLVYILVLLLFRAVQSHPQPANAQEIAFATALLFITHPLQTQAVTYIVQRFASLAALFYLLALVCYLEWRSAPAGNKRGYVWYAAALLSTVLAMKTKEITFTLPFMILLVEAVFFRPLKRGRWVSLIPFLLTLLIIPLSHMDALGEAEPGFAQETSEISRPDYLFTQFRVIVTYLRLLILPVHQNLDYDYPIYHSLVDPSVLLSFLLLSSLFALSLYLLFRLQLLTLNSQLIAFGILWFFLALSVESSIIPIRDVIFEHRVYLPSVGVTLAVSTAAFWGYQSMRGRTKWVVILLGVASMVMLSVATYQRNQVWQDDVTLWEDVVRKAPNKARGHNNLGLAYEDRGRLEEAIKEYQTALQLQPNYALAHNNLGLAYKDQGRLEEALREYQIALKLQPDFAKAHNNLGIVYRDQGRLEEAIREYQTALRLQPNLVEAHNNLGIAYRNQGRLEEAIREYQTALRLQPNLAEAHNNLGIAYRNQGRVEEAIREFQTALQLRSDYAEAHTSLGLAYRSKGMLQAARSEFEQALRIKPDFLPARQALDSLPR